MPELHLEPWPTADGADDALSSASSAHVIARFPCVLGRATSCDEWLDDAAVSRCHCVFSWYKGRLWVEDLGSLNGTAVNGKRLAGVQPLAEGMSSRSAAWPSGCGSRAARANPVW
jgi:pSer/pThr/pTyr-binding forkhead associated (FHA) protein